MAPPSAMGTAVENVEKDFWVCWLLDAFFNGLPATSPRRLFKGGTSLLERCSGCSPIQFCAAYQRFLSFGGP